ncbi:hypothetical protein PENSPDRAFT_734052 [Peniophora sp. CONT]|nr:hypothetical protein PENSPDRAFT_734052 [Peniophora sp. CONT]
MLEQLPPEILNAIFEYVQPKQLLDLRLCCRWLNELIRSSSLAQYRIECWGAGVIDDSVAGLPYAERLSLLRQRETRWRRGEWSKEVDIDVPTANGLYDLDGGLLILGSGRSKFSTLKLPSVYDSSDSDSGQWREYELEDQLVDFGLSVEDDDLIAVLTNKRLEGVPPRTSTLGMETFLCSFDLHFLSLSTRQPHHLSTTPSVNLCATHGVVSHASAAIQIIGDWVIVLLLNAYAITNDGIEDSLYVVNWKTGKSRLISTYKTGTYQGMIVLSENLVLFPNMRLATLDLFLFLVDERSTPRLLHCGQLDLPTIRPTCLMVAYQCIATPSANVNINAFSSPARPFRRPFRDSPENAIVVFAFQFEPVNVTLIMHHKALLEAAQRAAVHGDPVPYTQWGAGKCSWRGGVGSWITQSAGQRWITVAEAIRLGQTATVTRRVIVCDYNPYNVRRADLRSDEETELVGSASSRVVRQENFEYPEVFEDTVECGLSCFETRFEVEEDTSIDDFMLDSERLIGIRRNPDSFAVSSLNVKVFG